MTIFLLPVVGIAAVVALAVGVPGRQVGRWAGTAAAALVALGVIEAVFIFGLGGRGDHHDDDAAPVTTVPAVTTLTTTATESPAPTSLTMPTPELRDVDAVLVEPDDDADFPVPVPPADGLVDGDLLFVEAQLANDGQIRQCPEGVVRRARCGTGQQVPAPREGTARVLVPVAQTLATSAGEIDCAAQTCALVLFDDEIDEVVSSLPLVFGREATTPRVEVRDGGPFDHGEYAVVRLSEFPPGAALVLTQCTAPGPTDRSRCGFPAPEVTVVVGPDGDASVSYPVHLGRVGAVGRECRRAEPCAIAVVDSSVSAPAAAISLSGSPGPDVSGARVGFALVFAALLAAGAVALLARGDWVGPDGDPFAGVSLAVPKGWEHLRADFEFEPDDRSARARE